MEKILENILEEIKGVKDEVRETRTELRGEMQEMKTEILNEMDEKLKETKTELRGEMQEMKTEILDEMDEKLEETKTELRSEMDKKFREQSREIAGELSQIMILQERRDNKLEKKIDQSLEIQQEMLKDIREIKITQKEHNYRITNLELEYRQKEIEEKMAKVS